VQGYDITGVFMRNWDNPDEAGDDHQCPIDQVSE
jgi:tRNA U34 2-thiouridine synthase MnmA/TrmU